MHRFLFLFFKVSCFKCDTKAAFGCVKAFPENISFSGNAIFRKGKCIQVFGCAWNSFYRKSIPVFGSYKHFTENDFRFTENHFWCLFPSNILWKMKFIFYRKSFLMFGL